MSFSIGADRIVSVAGWPSTTIETQHSSASLFPLSNTVNIPGGTAVDNEEAFCTACAAEDGDPFDGIGLTTNWLFLVPVGLSVGVDVGANSPGVSAPTVVGSTVRFRSTRCSRW